MSNLSILYIDKSMLGRFFCEINFKKLQDSQDLQEDFIFFSFLFLTTTTIISLISLNFSPPFILEDDDYI